MARQRIIKPDFFTDEDLARCSPHARLLFAGLWMLADRRGRARDIPPVIQGAVFPFEPDLDADELLKELAVGRFIVRYEVDGKRFLCIPTFEKHQKPHPKEAESLIPPPPKSHGSAAELHGRAVKRSPESVPSFLRSFVPSDDTPSDSMARRSSPAEPGSSTAQVESPSTESLQPPPSTDPTSDEGLSTNGNHDSPERLDPSGFWAAVKVRLSGVIPRANFATWLRPLERAWWDGDVFVIEVPTEQFRRWLNGSYRSQVKAALHELHYDGPVKFSVRPREPATLHDGAL